MNAVPVRLGHRPYLMWGAGVLAYAAAVFHRSSLSVTGVEAADRFGVTAALLSTMSVAQLAIYAAMQIPVGMLLDRFGSRRLLATGATLMAGGQLAFALVDDVRLAIPARMLIGLGDAMTFISVLRVVTIWFPAHRAALMTQLTSVVGGLGALTSAAPLLLTLRHAGWTTTFLGAAGLGLAIAALVVTALRDSPAGDLVLSGATTSAGRPAPGTAARATGGRTGLWAVWAEPGTRLGMWTHFVTQFSGAVFALLWGYPFLVQGQGLAPGTAAGLLSLMTVASIAAGPLIGHFCGRLPYRRSTLVLAITAATATVWTVVLLWPGPAPLWLLIALVAVLSVNGPGAMVGFDFARSANPAHQIGRANGIVNAGGFVATILATIAIGAALDLLTPAGAGYRPEAFHWAFALQYLLWAVGAFQVLRYRNLTRRLLAVRDPVAFAALRRRPALMATTD